jgi:hypothetical protein
MAGGGSDEWCGQLEFGWLSGAEIRYRERLAEGFAIEGKRDGRRLKSGECQATLGLLTDTIPEEELAIT